MKRKVIFLDIDGTLTPPGQNDPPASALRAVRMARKKGHQVLLCTGRNLGMIEPLLPWGWDGYIASSGGYVVCGGQVIYDCPMAPAQQERAMRLLKENGIFRTIECRDSSYTDEGFKDFLRRHSREQGNSELLRWREQIEKSLNILPMKQYRGQSGYKIVVMIPELSRLEKVAGALEEDFDIVLQEGSTAGFFNGEIVSRRFNKGTAVRQVAEYLQVPLADTIGFGDSMNDLEMMQTVGLSICMDNGAQKLKEIADDICPGVAQDGLWHAFEKYGLL